ncbi:hypothetical protein SPM24T3_20342 [Serratia sp. M24T3]|nr:hypothetical protein SPM24T3_20342 [Serratia sp. M24T3]
MTASAAFEMLKFLVALKRKKRPLGAFFLLSGGPCGIDSAFGLTLRATLAHCRLASLGSNLCAASHPHGQGNLQLLKC